MQRTYCDICGRGATPDYNLAAIVTYERVDSRGPESNTLHICGPRDGGDIGCIGHFNAGLEFARSKAKDWLKDNRPSSLPDPLNFYHIP